MHCSQGMNTAPTDGEHGDFNYFYFYHYDVLFTKTSHKTPCDASKLKTSKVSTSLSHRHTFTVFQNYI